MSQPSPGDVVLSYSHEVVPPWWARVLLRPIGWPYFLLLGIACLWLFWAFRIPAPFEAELITIFFVIPFFGILWLLRIVLRLVLWRIYRRPWGLFPVGLWRFGVPLGVGLFMVLILYLRVPQGIAWRLSESALRRHAQAILAAEAARVPPATDPVQLPPKRVGLYEMSNIIYFPALHGVQYYIAGSGFLDHYGFAYVPAGLPSTATNPATMDSSRYLPMEGDWYSFEDVF
jgi:hypothetical protein